MTVMMASRRRGLAAAVGVVAAVFGAGLAWRRSDQQSRLLSEAEATLWRQQFARVDGSILALADFKSRPLVLNFWATWCPPCIEELPLLNAFYRENKSQNWQVLGLAVDQVEPVKRFLKQTPLAFPVALAGFPGVELSRALGNLSGGLPFTVVFDSAGQVLHRKMGRVSEDDLRAWRQLQS
jgi:thiol-disulfide isomerase/thioredoxin